MGKKRKTKQEKIILQLKRELARQARLDETGQAAQKQPQDQSPDEALNAPPPGVDQHLTD